MKEKIIPSAPFKNMAEIEVLAHKSKGKVERIQIDVCDGKFVKNTSWPFTEYAKPDFEKLGKRDDLDVFLPLWENLDYSVDLMVENPEKYIESFLVYGIDEVIIHYRSLQNVDEQFATISKMCEDFDLNLVLAIDVQTDFEKFLDFANKHSESIKAFQVMGIENIGVQGQDFAEESLAIVEKLKINFPEKNIYFDGGINDETIEDLKNAGVDIFCVGSYLTKADDFTWNLQTLKQILHVI